MGLSFSFNWGNSPQEVTRDTSGNWWYQIWSSLSGKDHTERIPDKKKVQVALSNPAFLKVLSMNCDLFSLGKINEYQNNELKEIDFLYSQKKKPNFYQTWTQWTWEYMFYRMIFGYSVLRRNGNILNDNNQIYWLNPANIDWDEKKFSKFTNSVANFNEQQRQTIKYTHPDGSTEKIALSELTFIQEMTNTATGNFYKGVSKMDALYKVLSNSESALDAKGVNLDFAKKFLVSGKTDPNNISAIPMGEGEKESIETKVQSNKNVHATKSPVTLDRFVKDIAKLELDESFREDYFTIGSMYNIPRDVLEASLEGSTYENQEKATMRHVDYSMRPAGSALTDVLEDIFSYQDLRTEWNHLSFNQFAELQREERKKVQLENIKLAIDLGYKPKDLQNDIEQILTM